MYDILVFHLLVHRIIHVPENFAKGRHGDDLRSTEIEAGVILLARRAGAATLTSAELSTELCQ